VVVLQPWLHDIKQKLFDDSDAVSLPDKAKLYALPYLQLKPKTVGVIASGDAQAAAGSATAISHCCTHSHSIFRIFKNHKVSTGTHTHHGTGASC
jgi:hypothetical protein